MGACDTSSDRNEKKFQGRNSLINSSITDVNKSTSLFSGSESVGSSLILNIHNKSQETRIFPKQEQYYKKIKDSNITDLIKEQNSWQSEKIELFFSLCDVVNPNKTNSLSVTIINNNRLGIDSYLGELDNNTGNNIDFGNSVEIDYFYERKQKLIIRPIVNGSKTGYEYSFMLSELIESANKRLENYIQNFGNLIIDYVSLKNNSTKLENSFSNFQFNINILNIKNITNSNVFFVLYHFKDKKKKRPVYKSPEYYPGNIKSNVIEIESDYLCTNTNEKIILEIYSFFPSQLLIAYGTFSLKSLLSNSLNNQLTTILLYDNKKENIGSALIKYGIKEKVLYLEKLSKNKMQINLEIAIDYTKSNKPPNDPKSNHFIYSSNLNDYEIAIKSCCEILAPYDADQLFPVYGFGGIPLILNGKPNNTVSHCFNINFRDNPEIYGKDNILKTYRDSLKNVELSGNTKFSFVLKKVISNINNDLKYKKTENHYYILLILTDGVVNDMRETMDLIVEGSYLPLSIVIVGIGNEDFSFMETLDGDEIPLRNSKGELRKRDIVQFIKFNNFKNNNAINIGTDFAEEVLKEIPKQIDEYYGSVGKFY